MSRRIAAAAAAVAAFVVLVAGGAAWWWSAASAAGPDAAAEKYVDALVAGDASALDDLGAFAGDDGTVREAFAGAADRPADPRLAEGPRTDDSADFVAQVELGDETRRIPFTLVRAERGWVLADGFLGRLEVSTALGDTVRVGGALVPAGAVGLLPAVYPVRAAPARLLDGEATAVVAGDRSGSVAVPATLAAGATDAARTAFDAHLDACAAPAPTIPPGCGIVVPWGADLASVERFAYRIDLRPELTLSPDARTFAATGGSLVITATGTTRDGDAASFSYRDADWSLRGIMTIAGEELTLSAW